MTSQLEGFTAAPAAHTGRAFDVLLILPPDPDLSSVLRRHKFPPQGPALLAAALRENNIRVRIFDLDLSVFRAPLTNDLALADNEALVGEYLRGNPVPELEALADEMIARLDVTDVDAFGLSVERYPQLGFSALLGYQLKRRFGKRIIMGGPAGAECKPYLDRHGARGVDISTNVSHPNDLRLTFEMLRQMPEGRMEAAVELPGDGRARKLEPDTWPVPDYGIYNLEDYRRDPFGVEPEPYAFYGPASGKQLVLGYNLVFNCLYACAFCASAQTEQVSKSPDKVVRDLATMMEKYETRHFAFMDTQINLEAPALTDAIVAAKLDACWSDSYRVMPSKPGMGERLRRAGCAAITVGVESASNRVLKKMVKGNTKEQASRFIREAHAAELMLRVNLLPCFPGETRADFEETRDWLAEHAHCIDDLSPSSFYLVKAAPAGERTEHFGIQIRGVRKVSGELAVRKNVGSMIYDEVGGLPWEERLPTLETTEHELREVWRTKRREVGDGLRFILTLSHMNALSQYGTKAERYAMLNRWSGHDRKAPDGGEAVTEVARPLAPIRPPKLLYPLRIAEPFRSRFRAAMVAAIPTLAKAPGRRIAGHMMLFEDGDYVCFQGVVERGATQQVKLVRMDHILASKLEGPRTNVYRRLQEGSTFDIVRDALRASEGSGRWFENIVLGKDYDFFTYGPE